MQLVIFIYTKSTNISVSTVIISPQRISSDHVGIKIIDYFQPTTTFRVMLGKDDFLSEIIIFHFPTF